jgi:predicted hydrocarbon binding protein
MSWCWWAMAQAKANTERIVDEVWERSLRKITKAGAGGPLRGSMGDDLDMVLPQATLSSLLVSNPAFARVLYTAGYTSAKRNAYVLTRQVGMPPDFFWQFDNWTDQRAQETMSKILGRIFAAIFTTQKQGKMTLESVDVERNRFIMAFGDSVDASGMASATPLCYFHAGLFAGILGALLDRDLDAVEQECLAQGGKTCRFLIAKPDDRLIRQAMDERMANATFRLDLAKRVGDSLDQLAVRELGNMVDVGYYQLLLSTVFLSQISALAEACQEAGENLGSAFAQVLTGHFPGAPTLEAVRQLYRQLRYTDLNIVVDGDSIEVQVLEAPEALGPLAQVAFLPFLQGELQALLQAVTGKALRLKESGQGQNGLRLRFAP